jgi:PAS domain S-box-containing protein
MTRAPSYDQPTDLVRLSAELAAIVESCDDAIISKDLNGTIRSWNQGAERLFGYTADEAIGQSVMMLIPEERAEEEPEIVDRLRRGERIDHFESVRIAKDGRRIHVSLTISPVRDAAGRIVGASKVARDISDRILAAEALREKDRQFRVMIDALPIAIYTTDAAGRLTHFNPAAVEFSGRVPELGTDHWCVSWKLFHPDGTPLAHDQCPMAIALKEGRAVRGEEAIAELPDGTRRWFEPFPTPLFDANGKLVGGINMLLDITERRRTEAVLREADQRKDEFLAMLAHELRNPLAPIRNSLQILRESAADREVVDRVRAIMDRQVSHMVRLVDDLMEVARITRDKIELRKERIGLDEVVRSAVETSQPLIDAFGHRLEMQPPGRTADPGGRSDPDRPGVGQSAEQRRQIHRAGRADPARREARGIRRLDFGSRRRSRYRGRHAGQGIRPVQAGRSTPRAYPRRARNRADARQAAGRDARRDDSGVERRRRPWRRIRGPPAAHGTTLRREADAAAPIDRDLALADPGGRRSPGLRQQHGCAAQALGRRCPHGLRRRDGARGDPELSAVDRAPRYRLAGE